MVVAVRNTEVQPNYLDPGNMRMREPGPRRDVNYEGKSIGQTSTQSSLGMGWGGGRPEVGHRPTAKRLIRELGRTRDGIMTYIRIRPNREQT